MFPRPPEVQRLQIPASRLQIPGMRLQIPADTTTNFSYYDYRFRLLSTGPSNVLHPLLALLKPSEPPATTTNSGYLAKNRVTTTNSGYGWDSIDYKFRLCASQSYKNNLFIRVHIWKSISYTACTTAPGLSNDYKFWLLGKPLRNDYKFWL